MSIRIGLEHVLHHPTQCRSWGRCGLLLNQASVDREVRPAQILLQGVLGERLRVLFTPQHGLFADKQDNMIESRHGQDLVSGLPFYSLYSDVREPTDAMLEGLDTLVVDIQDVGTRVYTFIYTLAGIMRACSRLGKRVVVLDRPNPIGGEIVEGNIIEDDSRSFVGEYPLPMRHGMTIGEIARWYQAFGKINVELGIVPMEGWQRSMHFADTGRPWVMTSPNIPTVETCALYPGTVLLEGTNMSEGRGTTMPFLMIGAPYLQPLERWIDLLGSLCDLSGLAIRPSAFEPTFHKWVGETCWGVHFVVMNPPVVRPFRIGLAAIVASCALAPDVFRYREPPYEYEHQRRPIQLLLGSSHLPEELLSIAGGTPTADQLDEIEERWNPALLQFMEQRRSVLLYPA
jgi:uncharacterized protein YbbC (DUF1343 family)